MQHIARVTQKFLRGILPNIFGFEAVRRVCVYERECGALLLDARHTGEEQSDLVCIEQCVCADESRVTFTIDFCHNKFKYICYLQTKECCSNVD